METHDHFSVTTLHAAARTLHHVPPPSRMLLRGASRWTAAISGGAAASVVFRLANDGHAVDVDGVLMRQQPVSGGVHVVRLGKRSKGGSTDVEAWERWISDMRDAAIDGAITADKRVAWLDNIHVASSSAQLARDTVQEDEDGDGESIYHFYLSSDTDDGAQQQGCMQVRVSGDMASIDALCSLGNHSGATFMRHLVSWLPTAAPDVVRIDLMPLSNGWLRQDYYAGLGFISKEDGSAMSRGVEAYVVDGDSLRADK